MADVDLSAPRDPFRSLDGLAAAERRRSSRPTSGSSTP